MRHRLRAVPRRGLTTEWSIDVDESFDSRVVDEDLQLVSPGPPVRTVWVAVWSPPEEQSPADVLKDIRADVNPHPTARFVEPGSEPGELRYASWYPEESGGRDQWSLYGYTVRRGSYVQLACIVDDPAERDWALETWRSLRFTPPEQ